jgi:hypothetical protein
MGSLTPVNPKIYETQIFGGDYPSFSSKVCRPVMIQFSIPFSLLWFAAILDKGVNSLRD